MNVLITGGAGFIGRWVVKKMLTEAERVDVIDNLSNSDVSNIEEFFDEKNFGRFYEGDILDEKLLAEVTGEREHDTIIHLAASINVQDSIDDPMETFNNDCLGTIYLLEAARKLMVRFIYVSTCLVYERLYGRDMSEEYPTNPRSPYSACKLAGEELSLSYYHAYGLPVVVLRPFNTYGPFQRSSGEGGVVVSFIRNLLEGKSLTVYGDGHQTRDFLYVEDCADFIVKATLEEKVVGEVINAGTGIEVEIGDLADMISNGEVDIVFTDHIHPDSEVGRLCCSYEKAEELLNWKPQISLEKGVEMTKKWLMEVL